MVDSLNLLKLRGAPLGHVVEALTTGVAAESAPSQLMIASDIAMDAAVSLIRSGTSDEILAAAGVLADAAATDRIDHLEAVAPAAANRLRGLLPLLEAARAPSAPTGHEVVARSWDGKVDRLLDALSLSGGRLARKRVKTMLKMSESSLSHMLADLEAAGLVERVREPGSREVELRLGPRALGLGVVPKPDELEKSVLPGHRRQRGVARTNNFRLDKRVAQCNASSSAARRLQPEPELALA